MVRKSLKHLSTTAIRRAFTMIELIFAIVVIAVVMLTIPTMILVNNKNLESNTNQEAIFLISAVLSETTTLLWDDHSLNAEGTATDVILSKILDVPTGNSIYNRSPDNDSAIRVGGLAEDKHRSFYEYNGTASQRPAQNSIDILTDTLSSTVSNQFGYKNDYTLGVKRSYVSDATATPFVFSSTSTAAGAGTTATNIKMIEVNISNSGELVSVLRAYTCNIGESDYAKRRF